MYPIWTRVLVPYTRLELRGWGRLLRLAKVNVPLGDCRWDDAPTVEIRGKLHGYRMRCDLADWSGRMTYFLGRYYEFEVQALLARLLSPGDRFVDIGANLGMLTLLGARLVGPGGTVEAFEPNPNCVALLRESLLRNAIPNVNLHALGLSDVDGALVLNLTSSHTGTATMAEVEDAIAMFDVPVLRGDRVLMPDPKPIKAIKIDVEGHELRVLSGLQRTLELHRPDVVTENVEAQLRRARSSSSEIFAFMSGLGYEPFGIGSTRAWHGYRLSLVPLLRTGDDGRGFSDVLWVHGSRPRDRLTELLIRSRAKPIRAHQSWSLRLCSREWVWHEGC